MKELNTKIHYKRLSHITDLLIEDYIYKIFKSTQMGGSYMSPLRTMELFFKEWKDNGIVELGGNYIPFHNLIGVNIIETI